MIQGLGVKLATKLIKNVLVVVEPHYSGDYLERIQHVPCYKPSWLEECFEKGQFVPPTNKHLWNDKTFGGPKVPEPSPDYAELPPAPKDVEQEIQEKRVSRAKVTAAAGRPKRGNAAKGAAAEPPPPAPTAQEELSGASNVEAELFSEETTGTEGELAPEAEGNGVEEVQFEDQLNEDDLKDADAIVNPAPKKRGRGARGGGAVKRASAVRRQLAEAAAARASTTESEDGDNLVRAPVAEEARPVEIRPLQREVFLRFGTTMPTWPEDLQFYRQPPRPVRGHRHRVTGGNHRPVFPDELLTSPRYEGRHVNHTRFSPAEDAAMLIWMVRAWPLIEEDNPDRPMNPTGLRSFQSPCLWHWAQQHALTSRGWETMKSRERMVLRSYFNGSTPLPDNIYAILKETPYFVYEGQYITMYNRTAVLNANAESANNPDKQVLIDRLLEMPPAVPVRRRRRSGPEAFELHPLEQDIRDNSMDTSDVFNASSSDMMDANKNNDELEDSDALAEPGPKRRKLTEDS